jgi:hypothetical protein
LRIGRWPIGLSVQRDEAMLLSCTGMLFDAEDHRGAFLSLIAAAASVPLLAVAIGEAGCQTVNTPEPKTIAKMAKAIAQAIDASKRPDTPIVLDLQRRTTMSSKCATGRMRPDCFLGTEPNVRTDDLA